MGRGTRHLREILPVGRIHTRYITAVIFSWLRTAGFLRHTVTVTVLQGFHHCPFTAALVHSLLYGTPASGPLSAPAAVVVSTAVIAAIAAPSAVIAATAVVTAAAVVSTASETG